LSRELAAAIEFRTLYGLRRDLDYVERVGEAADAQAGIDQFGVPLLPAEIEELRARGQNAQRVAATVKTYGERNPADWAGMFVDNGGSGDVVAQFSANVEAHTQELRALVGPMARLDVRQVAYSNLDLERLRARVAADTTWYRRIDAWFEWAEVSEIENRVTLSLSSANTEAVQLATTHFDADNALIVISDGIGRWEGGFGGLVVDLIDAGGQPTGGFDGPWKCRLEPRQPAAWRGGSLALVNGRCTSDDPLGATTYTVTVTDAGGDTERVVATGSITVLDGKVANLRLIDQTK
jgi:hypothetical protein